MLTEKGREGCGQRVKQAPKDIIQSSSCFIILLYQKLAELRGQWLEHGRSLLKRKAFGETSYTET